MLLKNNSYKNFILGSLPLIYVLTFLTYIFFISLLFKYGVIRLESISIVMAVFSVCGLIVYIINKKTKKVRFDFFDFLILLLTIFGIVSTIFAINKKASLMGLDGRYEGFLQIFMYYMLFLNCKNIDNKGNKKLLVNIILTIISVQSIYGILQFFDFKNIFGIEILRNRYYSNGFQTNPNFFGSLMVIGFSISISLYFFKNKSKIDWKYLMLSFLMFLGLLTSGAMSAVIAVFVLVFLVITLVIMLKFDLKTILIKSLIIISLFCCGYKVFAIMDDNYLTRQVNKTAKEINSVVKGDVEDTFGTGRIYIWRNALSIVPKNFLTGVGVDNFFYAFGEKKLTDLKTGLLVDKAHNEYLQKLVTEGVLSFITYLTMLGTIFIKSCIKILKEKECSNYFFVALFLCFASYSVQAFFNISVISVAPFYYIIMGVLASKFKEVKDEKN